ncbi:MAG: aminotransferase class I/II-fold pyridoxal phosphate-dependent enzyme [Vampirovibrionales bacterium]|nr:aminotransferase class I/II-fold pyridoxal phosphate-dependent enzyme [Vampirovibrionales bacterium]
MPQQTSDLMPEALDQADCLTHALINTPSLHRHRFHVPGHAGRRIFAAPGLSPEACFYDVSEVEGVDVLSEPSGCIANSQAFAANLFAVARTFFTVGGASVGIQAAMLCLCSPGKRVLVPRNAHRSVLSGLILTGAQPVWLMPDWHDAGLFAPLAAAQVQAAFQRDESLAGLVLTSPTYEGWAADVLAIAEMCQRYNRFCIVDEAHGSLFALDDAWPDSACHARGVDAVIHAAHKGLGSLTQTGLLHLPHGSRVAPEQAQQALNTLTSTSPSYLLLASLDAAMQFQASDAGKQARSNLMAHAKKTRDAIAHYSEMNLLDVPNLDLTKLFVTTPYCGEQWGAWLESERGIGYEAINAFGVLYAGGLGHTPNDWQTLTQALKHLDTCLDSLASEQCWPQRAKQCAFMMPDMACLPREAFFAPKTRVPAAQAVGRIAAETIVHCPPGIPVLLPGERVTELHVPCLPEFVSVVV